MGAPKSVIKFKKDNVEYISYCDQVQYYIYELSRAALRDVGKFVKRRWKEAYNKHFKRHTGDGAKSTKYTVISKKNTKYPRVQIGLKETKSGKELKGYYAYFQEFGTSKTPKLGILSATVEGSIPEIIKIESQYLSGLSGEASRLDALIDENDYEDDEDEN